MPARTPKSIIDTLNRAQGRRVTDSTICEKLLPRVA